MELLVNIVLNIINNNIQVSNYATFKHKKHNFSFHLTKQILSIPPYDH